MGSEMCIRDRYRKAAEQGDALAQYILGVMYDNGQGVPQNYTKAVEWYRKAAEQGHSKAQSSLGVMYILGYGVPQNYTQAYIWFSVAAAQGNKIEAKFRDITAKKLTSARLVEAQKRASTCFNSQYQDC